MDNIFKDIKLGKYQEEKIDLSISAFEAFKRLYGLCENMFLLESLGEEGKYNRFSYIGFDPLFLITAKGYELLINGRREKVKDIYEYMSEFARIKAAKKEGYCGGLVGYFSYEATKYFEKAFVGHHNPEFPDFEMGLFLDGLRFDKKKKSCVYFSYGKSRVGKILKAIHTPSSIGSFSFSKLKTVNKERQERITFEALEQIRKGNIFQVVVSQKTHFKVSGDTRRVYAILRQINPSPYMMYFKFGEREILSASPELLIRVAGEKIEHFGTLAGTIGRGVTEKDDKKFEKKLLGDPKEMAEHMMLVDLARNDVGRICEFGSIRVEKLASIKKFSHVQHIFSEIHGVLKKRENAFSALSACFPAGTLSGAPKVEALKIIANLEGEARGPYGGVGGYFSFNQEAMMAIIIRSFFRKGSYAYTQTGSGIVADSTSSSEFLEIVNKQKAVEEALREAQGKGIKDMKIKDKSAM